MYEPRKGCVSQIPQAKWFLDFVNLTGINCHESRQQQHE